MMVYDHNKNKDKKNTPHHDRKHKLSRLLQSSAFTFFSSIFNTLPLVIVAKNATNGQILLWNHSAAEISGIPATEAIGKRIGDLLEDQDLANLLDQDEQKLIQSGESLSYPQLTINTSQGQRVLHLVKTPITSNVEWPLIISIAQDITHQQHLEQDLEQQRRLTQTILDTVNVQIALIDHEGTIIALNQAWENQTRLIDPDKPLLFGTNLVTELQQACHSGNQPQLLEIVSGLEKILAGSQQSFSIEYENSSEGATTHQLLQVLPCHVDLCGGAVISQLDITKIKVAEQILRRQNDIIAARVRQSTAELQLFEKIFHSALEGITVTAVDGTILKVNDAFTRITGYSREEAIGKNPRILKSDRHTDEFYTQLWHQLACEGIWEGEIWNRRKNGEVYPEWLSINSISVPEDGTVNYVAVFHDITQLKEKEEHIERLAYLDPLTELPNRTLLLDRLDMLIKRSQREQGKIAVLFIDLDNFKNVNDSLGHPVGDRLICDIAEQLSRQVRNNDTVARVGGDEFIVICPFQQEREVLGLASRLQQSFQQAIRIENYSFYVTLSIGIAIFPEDGNTPDKLIQNADLALHQAKAQGKNRFQLFDREMNRTLLTRLDLEHELREAVETGTIQVHYQPQVDLDSGQICGFEALARWTRKDGTNVPPDQFIQVAEETGDIHQLGRHVLETACKDLQKIAAAGFPGLRMSVNLSAVQFSSKNLAENIIELLSELDFDANSLELEVTETIMMNNLSSIEKMFNQFHQTGIRISVDDFGTGYSSLAYLKRFPISALKIDRSFIRDIIDDENDKAIVEAILTMAKALEIETIAEGVENQQQHDFLRERDCTTTQGYLYSAALPLNNLLSFLSLSTRIVAQPD